jgi:hypothetical protein
MRNETEVGEELQVIAEAELSFSQNDEIGAGMCSCVCISNENCCGCLMQ